MSINTKSILSIAIFCLVASLWSETQGIDKLDTLESSTINCTANIHSFLENDIDFLISEPVHSKSMDVENSQTSLTSYLMSPVKFTLHVVNELTSFATNNPKLAIIIGIYSIINVANATMWCVCAGPGNNCAYSVGGQVPSCDVCPNACANSQYHSKMCSCSPYPPKL